MITGLTETTNPGFPGVCLTAFALSAARGLGGRRRVLAAPVRTALNVIGNALAVLVIARWEGMYDDAKGERYWNSLPHWRSKDAAPAAQATRS